MNIAIVGSRNAGNINLAQELEKRINIMEGDAIVSAAQGELIPLRLVTPRKEISNSLNFAPITPNMEGVQRSSGIVPSLKPPTWWLPLGW